jgi:hypothetical protein
MENAFEKLLQLCCMCVRFRYDIRVGTFVVDNHYSMGHRVNRWKDTLGIIASVTCAIHCAATPILLAFLPALKLTEWMASPQFHQVAAVVCVSLVSISIWPAFRRFKDYRVLSLSTTGLGLLIVAAFLLPDTCCSQSHGVVDTHDHSGHSHLASDGHTGHEHAGHTHAASVHTATEHASNQEIAMASVGGEWLAYAHPWMTPLGGLLLVVAHSLNLRRRFSACGKHCRCHGTTDQNTEAQPAMAVVRLSNPKAA